MEPFVNLHSASVVGTLATFDRMLFKGYLTCLWPRGAFEVFLARQAIPLMEFGNYVELATAELKAHAEGVAAKANRPFIYLASSTTKRSGQSKEELARSIAERDGIGAGLICVFSVLEPCTALALRGNRQTHRREVVKTQRKCLHFYFYYLDREFGLMHVRLQSWFPFTIQIYINGRAWLERQLIREGIDYARYENAFTQIADLERAQQLCERFAHRRWPRVLDTFARRVNPLLPLIRDLGFHSYYWVVDQAEYATDVMFRTRASLQAVYRDLVDGAIADFGAEDVLRFLGRKLNGNLKGEVTTDLKRRPEGWRIKHRMKRNSIKMYDKSSVLRIETTINNPREFKVLRVRPTRNGRSRRWCPMAKGVANIWRYSQVAKQSNQRYLNALAQFQPKDEPISCLDRLCRPRRVRGRRYARFNPITREDGALFRATLSGDHIINGFRNRDLQARLYANPARTKEERRRRSARTSRQIRKLRGHGLVAKVPGCRLYRVTDYGNQVMSAAIEYRDRVFPDGILNSSPRSLNRAA
jgi:hypothetical protein